MRLADRPMQLDDTPFVVALHRLPHVSGFMQAPTLERASALVDRRDVRARMIEDPTQTPVGYLVLATHDEWLVHLRALAVARPRQGIGRYAVRTALRWSFVDGNAERIWLEVVSSNVAMRTLCESEGFVHEGTYRHGFRHARGSYEDLAIYGMLRREFLN